MVLDHNSNISKGNKKGGGGHLKITGIQESNQGLLGRQKYKCDIE